jgi:hypothetical protein
LLCKENKIQCTSRGRKKELIDLILERENFRIDTSAQIETMATNNTTTDSTTQAKVSANVDVQLN